MRDKFRATRDSTAIIVIDMTNDFIAPGAPYESEAGRRMIPRLNQLLGRCREVGVPVIFTIHSHRCDGSDIGCVANLHPLTRDGLALKEGTPGVDLYPEMAPQPGDYTVQKLRYSAFYCTDLEVLLRNLGIDTVIISGVATNICCESTARDAFFRDYKVVFLSDGNATIDMPDNGWGSLRAEDVHRNTLITIAFGFGRVASIDEVMDELAAEAATTAPAASGTAP